MSNSNKWANDGQTIGLPNDDLLAAIGEVVVLFNLLDFSLSFIIGNLLGIDGRAASIVNAEMSFRAKVTLAHSLTNARVTNLELAGELRMWFKQLGEVEAKRNQIVHSKWFGRPDGSAFPDEG